MTPRSVFCRQRLAKVCLTSGRHLFRTHSWGLSVRTSRRLTALTGLAIAASVSIIGLHAPSASAAAGDAFDPARATIFIAQGTPTQLSIATPDEDGNFSFVNEGPTAPANYNGLSFSTEDNFLYAFVTGAPTAGLPVGAVVRIGQEGQVTRVGTSTFPVDGTSFNVAAIGPGGNIYAALTTDDELYVIDPATGAQVGATIPLSATLNSVGQVSDWAFTGGFLWGIGDNKQIVRINPESGDVDSFPIPAITDAGFAGAAWTNLDGTVSFSHNASGRITRVAIAGADAATPTFTVVQERSGPASSSNDGAASPGLPADLALTKTSSGFAPGAVVTYTLSVTNNGDGFSSGWTVVDNVPQPLTDIAATSDDAECAVVGRKVRCLGGELAPGGSVEMTVTAQVPAGLTGELINEASVTGNEPDPDLSNNQAEVADAIDDPASPGEPGEPGEPSGPQVPQTPVVNAGGSGTLDPASTWMASGLALLAGLTAATVVGLRRRVR